MKKTTRISVAADTVKILQQGKYSNLNGEIVNITKELEACVEKTQYREPDELASIRDDILQQDIPYSSTDFEVKNETTLQGANSLYLQTKAKIGVLNFASAKNPGGGFLNGSQAQEESLARSSGLYASLLKARNYYDSHCSEKSCLYSDRMIYSPYCPVFRDDDGQLLDKPYYVDFITSPAPNAGVVKRNEPENIEKIESVLEQRTSKLLGLFAYNGCENLVLGAWGCGVFQNEPEMVAKIFWKLLGTNGAFYGRFKKIQFSVFDRTKDTSTFKTFQKNCFSDSHAPARGKNYN
jgi:uncharacterized protein (TIGR02452 family)